MTQQSTIRHELAPDKATRWHECAKIFPVMEGKPRMELMRDIRDRGILEPIVFLDGDILDGRNRYLAARELCMVYPRREFGSDPADGDDPLAFVLSKNLHRRHLKESQRAMVTTKVATLGHGGERVKPIYGEQAANLPLGSLDGGTANLPVQHASPGITQSTAAEMMNVSERLVRSARTVQEDGIPALAEAVTQGDVSVSAAAEIARLPEEEQAEIVEAGPDAIKAKAAEMRNAQKDGPEELSDQDANLHLDLISGDANVADFLAVLDEAEQETDAAETDIPDADIEKSPPQIDDSQPDDPDEEPMTEEEKQARKGLSTLTRHGLEELIIDLRIENAGQKAEIKKLNRKIEEQEEQISYLSADDQAQEVIKTREETGRINERASYWQEMHAKERGLANRQRHVIKKLNKETDALKAQLGGYGGANDAA